VFKMRKTRFLNFDLRWFGFCLCLLAFGLCRTQAQLGMPPIITVQPVGGIVPIGGSITITVVVTSATAVTYKWKKDAKAVGSDSSSIVITNMSPEYAGTYMVKVSNAAGSTTSSNAVLSILPVITLLPSGMTTNGFQISLSGPPGSNYVIMASADMVNWTPISTNQASIDGVVSHTDPTALSRDLRYYRAMLQ
jgi:hypothetical protein